MRAGRRPGSAFWTSAASAREFYSCCRPMKTIYFMEESRPLFDYLNRHATRPEFVYRHQWRENDILIWDNRCTMHQALGDFDETQLRHLEHTTVLGTPSGYVVAG